MKVFKGVDRAEDLMVCLSGAARKIINDEEINEADLEPTQPQIKMQAAKMTLAYLALLR